MWKVIKKPTSRLWSLPYQNICFHRFSRLTCLPGSNFEVYRRPKQGISGRRDPDSLVYNHFSEVCKIIAFQFLLPSHTKESDSHFINPYSTNFYVDVKNMECGGRVEMIFTIEKVSI